MDVCVFLPTRRLGKGNVGFILFLIPLDPADEKTRKIPDVCRLDR